MEPIHDGDKGKAIGQLQRAINKRLRARSAQSRMIKVDNEFGPRTRRALVFAAYLLGADKSIYDGMRHGPITVPEQEFVRFPGRRDAVHQQRGKLRVAAHRKAVEKAKAQAQQANAKRRRICQEAAKAAANYRKQPGKYHYLAGGVANLIYLEPSPHNFRSDCSQFAASVFKGAGLPSPASVPHMWASTFTMVKAPGVRVVHKSQRKPGMLGMYGSLSAPHHVEIFVKGVVPGVDFIGHGSPPIDSLTPGEPDYYLDFPFLN